MYLAIKTYTLVPRNGVYRNFVDWVENKKIKTNVLFKDLLEYAKIFHTINSTPIDSFDNALRQPIMDFRKIKGYSCKVRTCYKILYPRVTKRANMLYAKTISFYSGPHFATNTFPFVLYIVNVV